MSVTAPLDRPALAAGAIVAAVVAVPAGVAAHLLDGSGALVLVALVGLAAGAARAARLQRVGTPLAHGIVTAVAVFALVQAIGVVRRAVDPDDAVSWSRVFSSLVLSVVVGTVGGLIGGRLRRRSQPEPGGTQP